MAKIDVTKIAGYAEMTAEQKLAALEAFEYEDNSTELERLKNANSKANSEAAEWRRKHNALLDEDEKKKQEEAEAREAMMKELEELRKASSTSAYTAKYLSLGYTEELAADTARALVEGNMDKVFANAEKYKAEIEKQVRASVYKDSPRPEGGTSRTKAITKEQFDNMDYSERLKLFNENKDTYNELMGGNE